MTMSPGSPGPTDFEGKAVPPYEGRRESADVDVDPDGEQQLHRDGADVGAATGPVETGPGRKAAEPADTARGAVASPAEERPAAESGGPDPGEASVGPAHHPGTTRGETVRDDDLDGSDQAGGTPG